MAHRIDNLILGLRQALGTSGFQQLASSHLDPLNQQKDLSTKKLGQVLVSITDAIARKDEYIAAELYNYAHQASHLGYGSEITSAWDHYAEILQGQKQSQKKASAREAKKDPLVPYETLKKITDLLTQPQARRNWIKEGMRQLKAADIEAIFGSVRFFQINDLRAIYLDFKRGEDDRFHFTSDRRSKKLLISITLPKTCKTPLNEKQIQLLVSRAILIYFCQEILNKHHKIPADILTPFTSVTSSTLDQPIPLVLFSGDATIGYSALSYGPFEIASPKNEGLLATVKWLHSGASSFSLMKEGHGSAFLAPEDRQRFENNVRASKIEASWAKIFNLRDAEKSFLKSLGSILNSPFVILMTLDPQKKTGLSLTSKEYEKAHETVISVNLGEGDFKKLGEEDLVEIVHRVFELKFARQDSRRLRSLIPQSELSLEELRHPRDFSEDAKLRRSYLKLAYAYHKMANSAEADPKIEITGEVGKTTRLSFEKALKAIRAHYRLSVHDEVKAAWDDIMNVRRWYFQEAGLEHSADSPVAELYPLGESGLIHFHGNGVFLKALDWLFLLSVMAANPGRMTKVKLGDRSILMGESGATADLYNGIAANGTYEVFGTYDPKARLPENIALGLPGGIPVARNPLYGEASTEDQKAYLKALQWFNSNIVSRDWLPLASDDLETIKKKYRTMSLVCHPDRRPTKEQANLFQDANPHWEAIFKVYKR